MATHSGTVCLPGHVAEIVVTQVDKQHGRRVSARAVRCSSGDLASMPAPSMANHGRLRATHCKRRQNREGVTVKRACGGLALTSELQSNVFVRFIRALRKKHCF